MGTIKDRAVITSLKVLPQRYMSHVAGVLMSTNLPKPVARRAVKAFFSLYRVNFDEVREPLETFPSLQSFFVRELKEGARPVDPSAEAFVSPCDGAWGASGIVEQGMALQVKGRPYSVGALLGDDALSATFDGGTFATLYLSPRDYHRFHAPCAGDVVEARHMPGALWPVNSAGIAHVDGLFAKNERIIAMVRPDSSHTRDPSARLAMIAVGATMVGKVHVDFDAELTTNVKKAKGGQHKTYDAPKHLDKGAQWGRFEFGSTIVLVATKGWLALDGQPAGTPLVLGTRIGSMR